MAASLVASKPMNVNRIAPLDALRGLAALGVATYHYELLTRSGSRPWAAELGWVYEFGQLAVPLFYLLSGYIFFSAYARPLGEGRLGGRDFFWLRASRLYPLHLLTLLLAAGLQALAWRATGAFFFYNHNDWPHFLLNLGFLQFSWFDPIMSFNGPSWSLSIEAALYVTFFAFARHFGAAARPRLAFGALCLAISSARAWLPLAGPLNVFFAEGLGCFFVGGCLQLTANWPDSRRIALGLATLALGVGLLHATGGRREAMPILFAGVALVALAPGLRRLAEWGPLTWLGEISYSVYLWHFPVQIALAVVAATALPLDFGSGATLALYLGLTLALATLSFRYFETPARGLVRQWAAARGQEAAMADA